MSTYHKTEQRFPKFQSQYLKEEIPGPLSGEEYFARCIRGKSHFHTVTMKLYDRAFIEKHGFRFEKGCHEDELFCLLSTLQAGRMARIKDALYLRRIRENSTMTKPPNAASYISYGETARGIMGFLRHRAIGNETAKCLESFICALSGAALNVYAGMDAKERRLVEEAPLEKRLWSHALAQGMAGSLANRCGSIEKSLSFRLGYALLHPACAARAVLSRLKGRKEQ